MRKHTQKYTTKKNKRTIERNTDKTNKTVVKYRIAGGNVGICKHFT